MSIAGKWDCISSTPMGDQKSVMDLACTGTEVTGTVTTDLETVPITEGQYDGRTFTWKMKITEPFKMNMSGEVIVSGDSFEGGVGAFLGKSDMRGTRRT
jgi:hypothetical protein